MREELGKTSTIMESKNDLDELQELIGKYESLVEDGDHKNADSLNDQIISKARTLVLNGELETLNNLATEKDERLRLWGASLIRLDNPDLSKKVFEELATSKTIIGIEARSILDALKKGLLENG